MTFPVKREIVLADSSAVLKYQFPADWDTVTSVTVSVIDQDGNYLDTDQATTILATTTLSAAVEKMDDTAVFTDDVRYSAGDPLRIGSAGLGYEYFTVEDYTASTKTLTTDPWFEKDYPATSATVQPRYVTYAVDASAWATTIKEFTVEWTPNTDDAPAQETWVVLSRKKQSGGMQALFAASYPSVMNEIEHDDFPMIKDRARKILRTDWETKGLDLDRLVDRDNEYEELLLRGIAHVISPENETYDNQYNDYLNEVDKLLKWIDTDEDLIKEDDEVLKGTGFDFRRKF